MKIVYYLLLLAMLWTSGRATGQEFSFSTPTLVADSLLAASTYPVEKVLLATPRGHIVSAWYARSSVTNRKNTTVVGVHPTQDKIYLLQQNSRRGKVKVLTATYQREQWSEPRLLFQYRKGRSQNGAYVSPDEDFIIFPQRGRGGYGQDDLYVVQREGSRWSEPINLGPTINTQGSEIAPLMYEQTLFFSGNASSANSYDIYQAQCLYQNWQVWEKPTLIDSVNSPARDAFFCLSADGKGYFASQRNQAWQVYQTTTDVPQNLAVSPAPVASDTAFSQEAIKTLLNSEQGLVFFSKNSWILEPQYKELLAFVAHQVKNHAEVTLTLVGHADQEGSRAYNKELSKNRATAIKDFLLSLGIEDERLEVVARGEEQPLVSGTSEEAQHKNRRVEIVVVRRDG